MPDIATETQLMQRRHTLRIVRIQFRECLADPLQEARFTRSSLAAAQIVWDLPMEAAAAGFRLEIERGETAWSVTLSKAIDDTTTLEAAGEAESLLKALFQVVTHTQERLDALDSEARHALEKLVAAPKAA